MSKSIFLCPYCRQPISKDLFDYKQSLRNIKKAVSRGRKERKENVNETLSPVEVCAAVRAPSYPKQLGWTIWLNEVADACKDDFRNAEKIVKSTGVKTPVNLPDEVADKACYVLNDFWYWALQRVYSVDRKKNAPRMELQIDSENQTCRIFCYDQAFDTVGNVLAANADPVCPYPNCNKILSCTALEITDDPIEIALIGDPNTGKTVWQVAIASFLTQNNKQYEIAPGKRLILPETIGWRTKLRADAFLNGKLPSQTPESAVGGYKNNNEPLVQMTSDDYGDYGTQQQKRLVDDRLAEDLVLLLREENERGQTKVSRFVRIFDFSGENSQKGMHGYDDLSILRNCEAMFFFADILTKEGQISINKFVEKSQNISLPYFAMMFPKVDLENFDLVLFRSVSACFEEALLRVCAYRLRLPAGQVPQKLRVFVKSFLRNYLHCSPEALGMFLCNHYENRMHSLFVEESGEDDVNSLFSCITEDPEFCSAFAPRDAKNWVAQLCDDHIYFAENPKMRSERPDEQTRRLYTNFYLRNLLTGIVNIDAAQKNADDIGLFPFSALGADNGLNEDTLEFNHKDWKPINLFDPLVWLLKEDSYV